MQTIKKKGEFTGMGETTALSALLTAISSIVTQVITWLSSVMGLYSDANPILILYLAFFVIGGCIGLFGRLLRRN